MYGMDQRRHNMEPMAPGIEPNFPPNYPFQWQQRIRPHTNPTRMNDMGLPTEFRPLRKGNRGNEGFQGYQCVNDYENYNDQEYYENECHNGNEYGDINYNSEQNENNLHANAPGQFFSNPYGGVIKPSNYDFKNKSTPHFVTAAYAGAAPIPVNKSQYYNLAPKPKHAATNGTTRIQSIQRRKENMKRYFGTLYCEQCDIGCATVEIYENHVKKHLKCPFPGCPVEACIDSLDKHITNHLLDHSASRKINDEGYLKQRKCRFPTAERAQLQQTLNERKRQRGELFGSDDQKPKTKHVKLDYVENKVNPSHVDSKEYESLNAKQSKSNQRKDKNIATKYTKNRKVKGTCKMHFKVPCFRGIDKFYEDIGEKTILASSIVTTEKDSSTMVDLNISDEEDYLDNGEAGKGSVAGTTVVSSVACNAVEPVMNNALGLLMGDYGSESECDDANSGEQINNINLNYSKRSVDMNDNKTPVINKKEQERGAKVADSSKTNGKVLCNVAVETINIEAEECQESEKKRRRRRKRGKKNKLNEKATGQKDEEKDSDSDGECFSSSETIVQTTQCSPSKLETTEDKNGEEQVLSHAELEHKIASKHIQRKYQKFRKKYRRSLLEKLLRSEVKRERNILLQCVKYIVENDFFEQRRVIISPDKLNDHTKDKNVTVNNDSTVIKSDVHNTDSPIDKSNIGITDGSHESDNDGAAHTRSSKIIVENDSGVIDNETVLDIAVNVDEGGNNGGDQIEGFITERDDGKEKYYDKYDYYEDESSDGDVHQHDDSNCSEEDSEPDETDEELEKYDDVQKEVPIEAAQEEEKRNEETKSDVVFDD